MENAPNAAILAEIQQTISKNNQNTANNLTWLATAMHPFFFTFNQDEIEALAMLANGINRIDKLPYIRLADRPERLLLAQAGITNSLHSTLKHLPKRDNLLYAEINTSLKPLPDNHHSLEILRFDYTLQSDTDIAAAIEAGAGEQLPQSIIEAVSAAAAHDYTPNFGRPQLEELLKLLWVNNQDYVRVSHPERLVRVMDLYRSTKANNGIHLDIQPLQRSEGTEVARVLFGVSNPPQHDFLLQVIDVFKRLNIGVKRAYVMTMSNGVYPNFLASFYVNPRDGAALDKGSERFQQLQAELYNTQILSSDSASFHNLVETGLMDGPDATLVKAMISFVHTNLAHCYPERFDPEGIQRAFHNHPEISSQLIKLFYARFKPELEERELLYSALLEQTRERVDNFNTGRRFLDETRRIIFRCTISFIVNCLKTNFFVAEKHALAFRLDPVYLDELDASFTADLPPERPFRITFFSGRSSCGYHIGFSDIARGGWRTLMTQGHDDYVSNANTLFKENYVLAHTQHLKNKDIYEGGSKMVAILNTRPDTPHTTVIQYLYKMQFGFTQAFLDLFVTDDSGKAKDRRVVDYYAQQEPIELGPDENMHDVMVEIIAEQAVERAYVLGSGIMSSKQVGINHKEYGVTSIGVIRFAEVTLEEIKGINMHQDAFSVKITGGPNGDVAGNSMRLLLERCPKVEIRMIIDGTGAAFDPQGLDHSALQKIILQDDLHAFDPEALHVGAYLIYRTQRKTEGVRELFRKMIRTEQGLEEQWISTDEFYKTFNSLPFTVDTDLFIPAGGRPETIAAHNVNQFFDSLGNPSADVIIEGANSFITPDARMVLQQRGVVIMRDASANKCGVISSSYEILGNLMLSDEEFLANKERYVSDVIDILNRLAEQEARTIIRRHREAGGKLAYTEISNQLSREINEHYSRMFAYFEAKPELSDRPDYRNAMLQHMPALIREDDAWRHRVERLPPKLKSAVLASKLAASLIYQGNDDTVYADLIEAQVRRLTH